jgi:molecular chaperone DnaK
MLKEYKEKLPADVVSNIESRIQDLKNAIAAEKTDDIQKATDELIQASQKMGEVLYRSTAGAAGAGPAGAGAPPPPEGGGGGASAGDGDVIDADFKESKG